jgi:hypothetical protein
MIFAASLGGILVSVGIIWLVVIAIQTGQTTGEKILWALLNLVCQPITGIIFYIVKRQGLIPLIILIIGCILMGIGYPTMMGEMMRGMPTTP